MEIRRFGIGYRRREGPPGTSGVSGQGIFTDGRGHIAELAFARGASIVPHSNPNTTWFLVIEGGGFVQVGDEQARVAAGEAILWPADVLHGAWTAQTTMRAIVVEFNGSDDRSVAGLLVEGGAVEVIEDGRAGRSDERLRADGSLAPKAAIDLTKHVSPDEEPW